MGRGVSMGRSGQRRGCLLLGVLVLLGASIGLQAADSFDEGFSAVTIPLNLEKTGAGPFPTFNGSNVVFTGSSPVGPPDPMIRSYLRTRQDGYSSADFVAEITTTIPPFATLGNHQAAIAYFGLGVGTNLNFGQPDQGPVVWAMVQPDDFSPGFYGVSRDAGGSGVVEPAPACGGDGTHRIRFQWISSTQTAILSIDEDYVGGPFVADCTLPAIDGGAVGLDVSQSRIFFGGDNTMSFDDLTVRATVAPTFLSRVITGNADGAEGVFAADVDGDGDLDVFSASFEDDTVAWHENVLGDGTAWVARTISTSASAASSVHADDVDGDGDMDVLVSSRTSNRIDWFENTAGDGSAWSERNISTTAVAALWVFSSDLDADGDVDVFSASEADGEFSWFENTAGDGSAWTERVIATGVWPQQIHVADVDGDGDLDAITANQGTNMVAWQENTAGDGTVWTPHGIESSVDDWIRSVYASDVDRDGDIDVLSASVTQNRITLHENTAGDGSAWTARVISDTALAAESVRALDVDADGDIDVVSASSADSKIAWYANLDGAGKLWAPHVVTTAARRRAGRGRRRRRRRRRRGLPLRLRAGRQDRLVREPRDPRPCGFLRGLDDSQRGQRRP